MFKADVINDFIIKNSISSAIEFGCGDGNQLSLMDPVDYLGVDISPTAVEMCRNKYFGDHRKRFATLNAFIATPEKADLTMSLDVIYHLIDEETYHDYMKRLFASSNKHCIIYSANKEELTPSAHVKKRKFTDWVDTYAYGWEMVEFIPNKYPLIEHSDPNNTSFADFYIFQKTA